MRFFFFRLRWLLPRRVPELLPLDEECGKQSLRDLGAERQTPRSRALPQSPTYYHSLGPRMKILYSVYEHSLSKGWIREILHHVEITSFLSTCASLYTRTL